jgi:hypothetical protein
MPTTRTTSLVPPALPLARGTACGAVLVQVCGSRIPKSGDSVVTSAAWCVDLIKQRNCKDDWRKETTAGTLENW